MVATAKHCEDYAQVRCQMCGVTHVIFYNRNDMVQWLNGSKMIQDALPYLSANDRELLLSGICGKCFDVMFPPLDNDE